MNKFIYRDFTRKALDEAYDNTNAVSNSAEILQGFETRSEILSKEYRDTMDISYGIFPREKFAYFAGEKGKGIFVFIHGGYWQMRNKNTFRFLAKGPLSQGFHVASIGYTLAPDATLTQIVDETKVALHEVCRYAKKMGADTQNVIVSGWSAGAHLASLLLNENCVSSAVLISGIYNLEPISKCYLNDALNLSSDEILKLSPIKIPQVKKSIAIVVGENELSELVRQSFEFAKLRTDEKISGLFYLVPNANHFTILHELENPEGKLSQILSLLKRS